MQGGKCADLIALWPQLITYATETLTLFGSLLSLI